MKKWIAGWLAAVFLFSAGVARAEGSPGSGTAGIQESVVTIEGEEIGSLAENLLFLAELMENEDVRALLSRKDVSDLFTEAVMEVVIWLYENRPVAMKVFAEMGVSEKDCVLIGRIWESFERVRSKALEYAETEDGKLLEQEWQQVRDDPDLQAVQSSLLRVLTSKDTQKLAEELMAAADTEPAEDAQDGPLTQQAKEKEVDGTTASGRILLRIMKILDENEWDSENLANLLMNEHIWQLAVHLANRESEVIPVAQEEFGKLMDDPETADFITRAVMDLISVKDRLFELTDKAREDSPADADITTDQKEDTAP